MTKWQLGQNKSVTDYILKMWILSITEFVKMNMYSFLTHFGLLSKTLVQITMQLKSGKKNMQSLLLFKKMRFPVTWTMKEMVKI